MSRPQIVNWSKAKNTSDEHVSHLLCLAPATFLSVKTAWCPADVACLRVTRRRTLFPRKFPSFLSWSQTIRRAGPLASLPFNFLASPSSLAISFAKCDS